MQAHSPALVISSRSARVVVLAVALGVLSPAVAPSGAWAQDITAVIGRPVTTIEFLLEGQPLRDPSMLAVLETQPGRPLALSEVRESVAHLMALERFADVRVVARPDPEGVELRYELAVLRRIASIRFSGDTGVGSDELSRLISERFGQSPSEGVVPGIEALVIETCRSRGFTSAVAHAEVVPDPRSTRATLSVVVRAGSRTRIGTLAVSSDGHIAEIELLKRLSLARGGEFDPVAAGRRATAYAEALRARGYFEASLSVDGVPAADASRVDVTVRARRGPYVSLEFRGDPVPESRRADLVPVQREGSIDQDLLENSQVAIETFFRAQGFRDASTDITRELDGDTLRIAVRVSRGPQYRVGRVELVVDPPVVATGLPASSALVPGELFVNVRLDAELARIAELFRRAGFREVRVRPELTDQRGSGPGDARTAIRIVVNPGPRTLIDTVAITGNHAFGVDLLRSAIASRAGGPLYDRQVSADREAVLALYAEGGFQLASVDTRIVPTGEGRVRLDLEVREGPRIRVDHVLVVGNLRVSTETIRRQLTIAEGQPLSAGALAESRSRLAAMGLFRQLRVTDRQSGDPSRRDVVVVVEEAPATTIAYGAGVEGGTLVRHAGEDGSQATETLEILPRGFFEIGRRNLWGKNRSVNLFTRASVRRQDQPIGSAAGAGGLDFREYRAIARYREPSVLGLRTEFVASGFLEQAIRSSYSFNRRGVAAELAYRFGRDLSLSGRYSLDRSRVFDVRLSEEDILVIDRAFPQVRISSLSASLTRDTRDDAIDPTSGVLVLADGELAAQRLGSEVGFLRTVVQGFAFRRMTGTRRLVLAGGARLGLSVGFPREVIVIENGREVVKEVKDVPVARRFFAGGEGTHRAFAADRLGAPDTLDSDGDPNGGRGLLLFNGEMRVTVTSWLSAVAFVDVGNVFASAAQISLSKLRPGVGSGVRVKTPLGPIRVDVGFKLNRRSFANGARERGYAIQFGIGQAF